MHTRLGPSYLHLLLLLLLHLHLMPVRSTPPPGLQPRPALQPRPLPVPGGLLPPHHPPSSAPSSFLRTIIYALSGTSEDWQALECRWEEPWNPVATSFTAHLAPTKGFIPQSPFRPTGCVILYLGARGGATDHRARPRAGPRPVGGACLRATKNSALPRLGTRAARRARPRAPRAPAPPLEQAAVRAEAGSYAP